MKTGVMLVNFGEPTDPTPEEMVAFLERIFLQNMTLDGAQTPEAARARARKMAESRAPELTEEYHEIGGSPLNPQAHAQAERVHRVLTERGRDVALYSAMQFTEPFVADEVARARSEGVERLVALPVYPMCGYSTTVAALEAVRQAADDLGWDAEILGIGGWHRSPAYLDLRADTILSFVRERGLDLDAPDTLLYFSAHGTPLRYLGEGNRYDRYVEECCREVATRVGVGDRYAIGFQNHSNRGVPWTQPDNEAVVPELTETHLVVDAISFMREQSETLVDLDMELTEEATELGKVVHRVPVPHDHPDFAPCLADLVEAVLDGAGGALAPCRCASGTGAWCLLGAHDLPPSPFVPADAEGTAPGG